MDRDSRPNQLDERTIIMLALILIAPVALTLLALAFYVVAICETRADRYLLRHEPPQPPDRTCGRADWTPTGR
jgi:hypothetical protein